jgi:putative peptidoglycan lipid II flippase
VNSPHAQERAAAGPQDRLLKATSIVGALTLLSRVTGLARDIALSNWFGAGAVMDAFAVAFRIPNLLRRFFAEGAFSQAFVPVISEYRTARTAAETRELLDCTAGTLGLALLVVTALGVVGAPLLILAFAPGFLADDGRFASATAMLRWTFPYVLFVSLTAFAGSVLNSHRRFAVAAFTPVLLNVVLIVFAGWVEPLCARPGLGLAVGVFAAGVVQLLFQGPFLARLGLLPRPRWDLAHEGVRRIVKLMLPALFGSSVAQISIVLATLIASFLTAGSISWLYYADRLVEFPLGVFGIAVATVILPRLSEQHVAASHATFAATLDWALRLVLLIALPAAVALLLLAEPLVATLFYRGEFSAQDVAMAAAALRAYAPGLVGFILVKVLAPGYFARQDTRTPVRAGLLALSIGMVLNVVFVLALIETGLAPAHAGIAAATSCSSACNAARLFGGLVRARVYTPAAGWRPLLLQVGAATLVMAGVLVAALAALGNWYALGRLERVGALGALVIGGAAAYFAACFVLGLRTRTFAMRAAAA